MKFYTTIFIILGSILIASSQDGTYSETIEQCYQSANFKKERYRIKHEPKCYVGLTPPQFKAQKINGDSITSDDLLGEITVLNFWFTSCPPCIAEMPGLLEVSQDFQGQPVRFISVATDKEKTINRFITKRGTFGFEIIADRPDLIFDIFQMKSGFPTTLILDQDGVIIDYFSGGFTDFRASRRIRKKLTKSINAALSTVNL